MNAIGGKCMPDIEITHKCGHKANHNLPFKSQCKRKSDKIARERRIEELQHMLCKECYVKEQKSYEQQILNSVDLSSLPELTGSAKQINWAMTIRAKFKYFADQILKNTANYDSFGKIKQCINNILDNASSKFWIENRDLTSDLNDTALWVRSELQTKHNLTIDKIALEIPLDDDNDD